MWATDRAGNTEPAATVSWLVDTTAPLVTIVRKPSRLTSSIVAGLAFRANEAGARFACSLDASHFGACSSPKSYGGLAERRHTFAVRAKDPAGNLGPIASYSWRIDATAPGVSVTSKPLDLHA